MLLARRQSVICSSDHFCKSTIDNLLSIHVHAWRLTCKHLCLRLAKRLWCQSLCLASAALSVGLSGSHMLVVFMFYLPQATYVCIALLHPYRCIRKRLWCSCKFNFCVAEQGVRGSIPVFSLANTEIWHLKLPSRDMTERYIIKTTKPDPIKPIKTRRTSTCEKHLSINKLLLLFFNWKPQFLLRPPTTRLETRPLIHRLFITGKSCPTQYR